MKTVLVICINMCELPWWAKGSWSKCIDQIRLNKKIKKIIRVRTLLVLFVRIQLESWVQYDMEERKGKMRAGEGRNMEWGGGRRGRQTDGNICLIAFAVLSLPKGSLWFYPSQVCNELRRLCIFFKLTSYFCFHIVQEDVKSVCMHVSEEYKSFFQDVDYVSTFKGLLLRYEQEEDRRKQNSRLLDRLVGWCFHWIITGVLRRFSGFRWVRL